MHRPWAAQQPDDQAEVLFSSRKRREVLSDISEGVNYGQEYLKKLLDGVDSNDFDEDTGGSDGSGSDSSGKSPASTSGSQCTLVLQGEVYDFPCSAKANGLVCQRPLQMTMPCKHNQILFQGMSKF